MTRAVSKTAMVGVVGVSVLKGVVGKELGWARLGKIWVDAVKVGCGG